MPNIFQRIAQGMRNFANRVIGAGPQPTPVSPAPPAPPPPPPPPPTAPSPPPPEEGPTPGMQDLPPTPEVEEEQVEYFPAHDYVIARWCISGDNPPDVLLDLIMEAHEQNGEPDFLTFIITGVARTWADTGKLRQLEPGEEGTRGFVWGWEQVIAGAMDAPDILTFVNNNLQVDPEYSERGYASISEICILDKRRA